MTPGASPGGVITGFSLYARRQIPAEGRSSCQDILLASNNNTYLRYRWGDNVHIRAMIYTWTERGQAEGCRGRASGILIYSSFY
jgi:hypothetical protein